MTASTQLEAMTASTQPVETRVSTQPEAMRESTQPEAMVSTQPEAMRESTQLPTTVYIHSWYYDSKCPLVEDLQGARGVPKVRGLAVLRVAFPKVRAGGLACGVSQGAWAGGLACGVSGAWAGGLACGVSHGAWGGGLAWGFPGRVGWWSSWGSRARGVVVLRVAFPAGFYERWRLAFHRQCEYVLFLDVCFGCFYGYSIWIFDGFA